MILNEVLEMNMIQKPSGLFDNVLPKPKVKTKKYVPSVFNYIQNYDRTVLFNT